MDNKKKYIDENGLLFYDKAQKERLEKKVDKEFKTGSSSEYKVLSDNNLTDELKQKILNAGTGSFTGNYDDLMGIPTLDDIQIKGNLTKEELDIAKASDLLQTDGDLANAMADIEEIQNKQKDFLTDKQISQKILSATQDMATQTWVEEKGYQNENQVQNAINSALEDIAGIDFEVVDRLPSSGKKGIIYLVPNNGEKPNIYDEYIWLEDKQEFEKIGTTDIDLSNYWSKDDLVALNNEEIQEILDM